MMEVKHSAKIISITLVLTTSLFAGFAGFAVADGTHGVAVHIVNNSGHQITVQAYNGKDAAMWTPHKVYYIDNGGTRTVKSHGQGKGYIKLLIVKSQLGNSCKSPANIKLEPTPNGSYRCTWSDGDQYCNPANNGATYKIIGCP